MRFIIITQLDGNPALIPLDQIKAVCFFQDHNGEFKPCVVNHDGNPLVVAETFDEIAAKIREASK